MVELFERCSNLFQLQPHPLRRLDVGHLAEHVTPVATLPALGSMFGDETKPAVEAQSGRGNAGPIGHLSDRQQSRLGHPFRITRPLT